jgi:hypothetical protein
MINRVLRPHAVKLAVSAIAAAGALAATPAQADTLFFDDFEDGDVSDWTLTSNHDNPFRIATTDAATGDFALETYLEPGRQGGGFNASATKEFILSRAYTNVVLSFSAKSVPCDTCTISYEGNFNDTFGGLASFSGTDLNYTPRIISIPDLAAGTYRLRLGVFTTQAFAGRFSAKFDDVSITGTAAVPEPATWAMMIGGFAGMGVALRRRRSAASAA